MGCDGLRNAVTGVPLKIDDNGSLQSAVRDAESGEPLKVDSNGSLQSSVRDPVSGDALKIDEDGNLQATVRDPDTGIPLKIDENGNAGVSGTVRTRPPAWTASEQHGGVVDDVGDSTFALEQTGRVYIRITNNGPNPVCIFPGSAATVNDTLLAVGQSMEFTGGYEGAWTGITLGSSLTSQLSVIEFYIDE